MIFKKLKPPYFTIYGLTYWYDTDDGSPRIEDTIYFFSLRAAERFTEKNKNKLKGCTGWHISGTTVWFW